MPLAIPYLRVSTTEQHLGPEAQLYTIQRWCELHNHQMGEVYIDKISGGVSLEDRPALLDAFNALEKGDVLIVAKRDRLARDTMVAAMVERMVAKKGAKIVSADGVGNGDGPEAMFLRGLMDLLAQYERAVIRARTRAALAAKKRRGERAGNLPMGYSATEDGKLVKKVEEQEALTFIHQWRDEGETIRGIATRLNESGLTPRGREWYPTTVARLLKGAEEAA